MSECAQSPINLQARVVAREALDLRLHWKPCEGRSHYGEHGLKINFPPNKENYASLNGKHFLLMEAHFHYPAEHFLDGKRYAAELHIVHQNLDDLSHLVLCVFLDKVEQQLTDSKAISSFADSVKKMDTSLRFDPNEWIPTLDPTQVLRYEGSLTTPPYTESVSWVVFRTPKQISDVIFKGIFRDTKPHARTLQPLNRRYVVEYEWKG